MSCYLINYYKKTNDNVFRKYYVVYKIITNLLKNLIKNMNINM